MTTAAKTSQSIGARSGLIALVVFGGMLVLAGMISPATLAVLLGHGPVAVWIVAGGASIGLLLINAFRLERLEWRWRLLGGTGLGLGVLSLLILALGSVGILNRWLWAAIVTAPIPFGLRNLILHARRSRPGDSNTNVTPSAFRWLWMAAVPFGALALVAASFPPGVLWPEEGNGYDVLEYHLGAPREYFDAGRIEYLPHNIYANFPANVEMLHLLSMVLHGDPLTAALTAKLLNALLAMLAVGAVWLAASELGRLPGIVAGALAATCPLITYLCGVAYVENGLVFYSALALAAMLRSEVSGKGAVAQLHRWLALSGAFAGLACGCKYTGAAAAALPLALAALRLSIRARPIRWRGFALFVIAGVAAFLPWVAKNLVYTGNPVFPLARAVFSERPGVWDDDGAARWHEGHLPAPEDRPAAARLRRLWTEVLGSPRYGIGLIGGVIAGLAMAIRRRRTRRSLASAWLMLLIGVACWTALTHLVDRFAIVAVVPAFILAGAITADLASRPARVAASVVVLGIAAANLAHTVTLFSEGRVFKLAPHRTSDDLEWFTKGLWPTHQHVPVINRLAAEGRRVLMVGDARRYYLDRGTDYCVVFNRNPFAEAAATHGPSELMRWLRERGYDFVYVDWGEMRRLRNSRYGFWRSIDAALFERLTAAGLRPVEQFAIEDGKRPYSTLFATVAQKKARAG